MKRKLDDKTSIDDLLEGWTRCRFFLTQKRRLCRMEILAGTQFCGNHQPLITNPTASVSDGTVAGDVDQETSGLKEVDASTRGSRRALKKANRGDRIPCPLDPSHNIFQGNLDVHLKICNESKKSTLYSSWPYFCQNCNGGETNSSNFLLGQQIGASEETTLVDVDDLAIKLEDIYSSIESNIPTTVESDDKLLESTQIADIDNHIRNEIGREQSSFDQLRHVEQDIKIVHHMISARLLKVTDASGPKNDHRDVFLEFGAGKGLLGYAVHFADPTASIGLVERSSNRKKIDKFLTDRNASFERYRMDIRHCLLPKLPLVIHETQESPDTNSHNVSSSCKVAVIAKHLCGVASDLAIRSLCHLESHKYGKGLALATCCHHACQFDDYVGRNWLASLGVSRAEFDVMKYWTGWASLERTATYRKPAAMTTASTEANEVGENGQERENDEEEQEENEHKVNVTNGREVPRPKNKDHAQLASLGRKIKRIIDYGRLLFIREALNIPEATMIKYCDEKLSPECILLLANSG